jgi:hypothetical protein
MALNINIKEEADKFFPDKPVYESITFWGAVAWLAVDALNAFAYLNPELGTVAKGVAAFLIAVGIRRHLR